jgi:hypothetical protein
LGYQASATARNALLQGAFELRNGVPKVGAGSTAAPDVVRALTTLVADKRFRQSTPQRHQPTKIRRPKADAHPFCARASRVKALRTLRKPRFYIES